MAFIGGPRQVGKTTLALSLLKKPDTESPAYLNWDDIDTKKSILKNNIPHDEPLLIFDEIHKYKNWRNLLKGIFDKYRNKNQILVTGSARLDYYRKGGDSLQGRYHYYRLHPFTLPEIAGNSPSKTDINDLLEFGGFPEPLFKSQQKFWKRWQNERMSRVIQDDLFSLEKAREVSQLELLASVLPERTGSILSINSIREDLNAAYETIERWIQILENIYLCFRIPPYGVSKLRTAKKEKKLYMWDWSLCKFDKGKLFENFVASHLLKYCHFIEDTEGDKMKLMFLRDSEKREIDFVVSKNNKPVFAVECKSGEAEISKNIKYFSTRADIPVYYQVHFGNKKYENTNYKTIVLPFGDFCKKIPLV
ncbi:MAG: ATP-binding protein [Oligoflexia bacterium]|nr:ATP-binding protein [Oligoflexia bacterium]